VENQRLKEKDFEMYKLSRAVSFQQAKVFRTGLDGLMEIGRNDTIHSRRVRLKRGLLCPT